MIEVIEWMKEFFANPENIRDIVNGVVIFLIGVIFPTIYKGVRILFKWLITLCWRGVKKVVTKSKRIKEDRKYKRTIKQIERKEIPIPENFLWGKSPEKNPELRKIFQMIEDGVIEAPASYKLQKSLKDHSILDELKKDAANLSQQQIKPIKLPPFKK
ncbi:hypothetical protein AM232_26165 [Bacillus sp. FJAT-21352]|nr:hypothetical protein AM232_26165 [Bacillus sp. FJAT-21352]